MNDFSTSLPNLLQRERDIDAWHGGAVPFLDRFGSILILTFLQHLSPPTDLYCSFVVLFFWRLLHLSKTD